MFWEGWEGIYNYGSVGEDDGERVALERGQRRRIITWEDPKMVVWKKYFQFVASKI